MALFSRSSLVLAWICRQVYFGLQAHILHFHLTRHLSKSQVSNSGGPDRLPIAFFPNLFLFQAVIPHSTQLLKPKTSHPTLFFFLILFIHLCIYCLFLAVLGLMCRAGFLLVVANRSYSSLWCASFSLQWLLLFWNMGSRAHRLSNCGSQPLEHRLNSCGVQS